MADPTGTQDAATTNDVDVLGIQKFAITSGTIQNSIGSDITLYTIPSGKTVDNAKIWIINYGLKETHMSGLTVRAEVLKFFGRISMVLLGFHQL